MARNDPPETVAVQCPHCARTVHSKIGGATNWYVSESGEAGRYLLASCEQCQGPILFSQDYEQWEEKYDPPIVLYPTRERAFGGNIPPSVRIAFEEAETCFKASAHTASALMCRRSLEAITHEKGASGRTLAEKIKALEEKGLITGEFTSWFDMLRQVGNQAAHDVTAPVSSTDARDTLDFTHALIEFIYSYRQKFEDFKNRRTKPLGPSTP